MRRAVVGRLVRAAGGVLGGLVVALGFVTAPARADIILNGITYLDPTSFHVTSSVATGSDPVFLNNSQAFSIQDIGGENISQPLTIFIATPVGAAAPTLATASYTSPLPNSTTTLIAAPIAVTTVLGVTFPTTVTIGDGKGQDLYSLVGCTACDGSLNKTNVDTAYGTIGLSNTTSMLRLYAFQVSQPFVGKDQVNFTGTLAKGDIVFPYAQNVDLKNSKVTEFDTSWTNTGLDNVVTSGPPPPPPPPPAIPEPASVALLGIGLLGLGWTRWRRG